MIRNSKNLNNNQIINKQNLIILRNNLMKNTTKILIKEMNKYNNFKTN